MIIFWRGFGIVVFLPPVVAFIVADGVRKLLQLGVPGFFPILGVLLIPAGAATWYLGRWMNRNMDRVLVDPATGEQVTVRNDHSLFFIRVEWWGPVTAVIGVVILVAGLINLM